MNEFRYKLEKYSGPGSRYICPKCGKKSFVLYVDTETGRHLGSHIGRCNHENTCGYHVTPKEDHKDDVRTYPIAMPSQVSYISPEVFRASLTDYDRNNFVIYLRGLLGDEITNGLIHTYNIGTSRHWPGSVVFWQMDIMERIRTGKIMLYDIDTCKRVKEPYDHITWVHSVLKLEDFGLKQCLFGEHLLRDTKKTIAVVESEKTAIIASAYLPKFTWLACGGVKNLTAERCAVLKDRTVILYPDAGFYELWNAKAKELSKFCNCKASNIIERSTTEEEKKRDLDIADFLINSKCTPPHEDADIIHYWAMFPKVVHHFAAHPEDRELFHQEFCREYRPIGFTEFEKYSLSIN